MTGQARAIMLFYCSVGRFPILSPAPKQIFDPAFSNKSRAQLRSEQGHSSVNAPAPRQEWEDTAEKPSDAGHLGKNTFFPKHKANLTEKQQISVWEKPRLKFSNAIFKSKN